MEESDEHEEDSDSDSDDDSASDSDVEMQEEDIALLEARLKSSDGRDYDAFVQLLRMFRRKSQLSKLEKIREEFSAAYPLGEGTPAPQAFRENCL